MVDNKRQWISKSGFRTKAEAIELGTHTEYLNARIQLSSVICLIQII